MPDGSGENIAAGHVAGGQLLNIIERVERLNEEIKGMNGEKADVFAECKAYGFDPKTVKAVIRRRAMSAEERQETDALLEMYCAALGMD